VSSVLSSRSLVTRVVVASALCVVGIVSLMWLAVDRASSVLLRREIANLLTAIETGPAQFANLNSREFAEGQLAILMDKVQKENHHFIDAAIVSGEGYASTYASWRAKIAAVEPTCVEIAERRIDFENAIYPFKMVVRFDRCAASRRFREVGALLGFVVSVGFAVFLLVLARLGLPVVRSFRAAKSVLEDPHAHASCDTVEFAPVRELASRALTAKAFEREAALARVVQNLIHDLRTPLVAFERVAEVISWEGFVTERGGLRVALVRLHTMLDALRRNELESLVRLEHGELSLWRVTLEAKALADERGVTLRCDTPRFQSLYVDLPKVERTILNLLRNSIESGAKEVKSDLKLEGDAVVIEVWDDGPGVPEALMPRLFQRGASLGKEGGTGLGLSYAQSVARGHGGDVSYERRAGWTVFGVRLPGACAEFSSRASSAPQVSHDFNPARESIFQKPANARSDACEREVLVLHRSEQVVERLKEAAVRVGLKVRTRWEGDSSSVVAIYGELDLLSDVSVERGRRVVVAKPDDIPERVVARIQRSLAATRVGGSA
jgi:signal transduction histidine kinase